VTNQKKIAPPKMRLYPKWVPFAFILPQLLVFSCFSLFPILVGAVASFSKWTLGSMPTWIGLENFRNLFVNQDSMYYWQLRWGLMNTLKFVLICVPFRIVVPMLFALVLMSLKRRNKLFQTLFYLPSLLSLSVVMAAWNYMFNTSSGVINIFMGLGKLQWTNTVPYNWIALILITVWWGTGTNMIIYQSALAGVPQELLEAANVDGANGWQRFFHITIPSIRFPLQYTIITSVIAEFGIWGQPDMFNNGGPTIEMVNGINHLSNKMILQYIAENGFGTSGVNAGMASAMALTLGVVIFAISLLQFKVMRKNAE
jgi:multiple sugar transport system permease protein